MGIFRSRREVTPASDSPAVLYLPLGGGGGMLSTADHHSLLKNFCTISPSPNTSVGSKNNSYNFDTTL